MIAAVASLGGFATIFASGFGVLRLLVRWPTRLNLPEQFGLSWLLGTGVVSLLLWVSGFLLRGPLLAASVVVVCVALPLLAWKISGRSALHSQRWQKERPAELLLATLLVFQVAFVFYLAAVRTLGWDGLLNWEIKARYAFSNGGALPAAYFQSEGRLFTHPDYPLAIPFSELWIYFWLGEAHQFWAKMIFPMFYAAGTMLLTSIGARLTGKTWVGLAAAILVFFVPQIATEPGGSATAGYADLPLSILYLATIGYLVLACQQNEDDSFRIYAACLALLPWIKREGVILWFFAAFLGTLVIWRRKRRMIWLSALFPGPIILFGWHFYLAQMHAISCPEFFPVSLSTLLAHADRIGALISLFASQLVNASKWGLFWMPVAIACLYLGRKHRDFPGMVMLLGILAPLVTYPFIFIFSAWPDYVGHVVCSGNRLFLHVAPLCSLAVWLAIAWCSPKPVASETDALGAACKNVERERTPEIEFA